MWLEVTQGLDITEAYEASHVFEGALQEINAEKYC